mgnify:CR=1 FL=1|tara:strand:- start:442 stop:630 length:189 start_codon:yes stop_codon:yes gene_type:complete
MTLKTHTVEKKNPKHNQIWEWEETPELLTAIEQLQKSSQAVKDVAYKPRPIHVGNANFAPLK